jgi:hypothetical protein
VRNCAGVFFTALPPALRIASLNSGSSAILISASDSLAMIGSGVLGGAMMPFQVSTRKLGTTASWIEGIFGK